MRVQLTACNVNIIWVKNGLFSKLLTLQIFLSSVSQLFFPHFNAEQPPLFFIVTSERILSRLLNLRRTRLLTAAKPSSFSQVCRCSVRTPSRLGCLPCSLVRTQSRYPISPLSSWGFTRRWQRKGSTPNSNHPNAAR